MGEGQSDLTQDSPPGDNPVPASGRRPLGEKKPFNSFETKAKSEFDKGKILFDGYAPGQAFKSKPGTELVGEIQQAAQQAPDAIEVQRIPKAARDMAKGYFKNLGGQKDEPVKETPKK